MQMKIKQVINMNVLIHQFYELIIYNLTNHNKELKGALDNILKFSFGLNFINQVKTDC